MKQVTVTFTTNDTVNDMSTVESEIIRVAEMNSGVETGSGFGPEGRERNGVLKDLPVSKAKGQSRLKRAA